MSSSTKSRSQREQSANGDEKAKPLFTRRVWTGTGSVEVSVWSKMIEVEGGEMEVFNVVAKRSWKTDNGYESGNSFRPEDLLPLALFLQEAWQFVNNEQQRK